LHASHTTRLRRAARAFLILTHGVIVTVKLSSAPYRKCLWILRQPARLRRGSVYAPLNFVLRLAAVVLLMTAATSARAQSERAMTDADVPFVVKNEDGREEPALAENLQTPAITSAVEVPAARGRRKRATHPAILKIVRDAGRRHAVDPELILSVMAQESNFIATAVSYKDGRPCARGLMQLTPPTAARFGVADPFDPGENIEGGVRYLRFLLDKFGDERLDLVLAGYNAGEGAVLRYNRSVPPYKETRNYVRTILSRYNSTRHLFDASIQ
jgi:soluble lytic murein transglycosylase-like protein